jgi:hypothetical protein
MMYLAGGFANERAMGVESTEVGSGWAKAYDDDAAVLAAEHGYNTDMANAPALVEQLSGYNLDEAGPYLTWLAGRTRTIAGAPLALGVHLLAVRSGLGIKV